MLYVVMNEAIYGEIDAWTLNQNLLKEYLKQEEKNHHKDCWVEEWDDRKVLYGTFTYPLDPTKELIVKENIVGECYLLTRGDYVRALNEFSVRNVNPRRLPVEDLSTITTILGIYLRFIKDKNFMNVIRDIRKREWKIDPFTYESRWTMLRKRKIK